MTSCPATLLERLDASVLKKIASTLSLGREGAFDRAAQADLRGALAAHALKDVASFLGALPTAALKSLCRAHAFPESGAREGLVNALARALPWDVPRRYAALDFETANMFRESACAVSLVVVEEGAIVDTYTALVKPPRGGFQFTYIHGITAGHVANAPTYPNVHAEILRRVEGASFVAAHNASFDSSVMRALCEWYGLAMPLSPWRCTVKLARTQWSLSPARLPDVCRHLGLPLRHHDATSDATACARIVMAALSERAQ